MAWRLVHCCAEIRRDDEHGWMSIFACDEASERNVSLVEDTENLYAARMAQPKFQAVSKERDYSEIALQQSAAR